MFMHHAYMMNLSENLFVNATKSMRAMGILAESLRSVWKMKIVLKTPIVRAVLVFVMKDMNVIYLICKYRNQFFRRLKM